MLAVSLAISLAISLLAGCPAKPGPRQPDKPPRSALGVFMKAQLNPPFSKLSYLLFHQEEDGSEVAPTDLPAAAADLVAASEALTKWAEPPGDDEQGRLVFYEYAGTLKADAISILESVKANDKQTAMKRFSDLRKKCDSCHHFFRYEGTVSLDTRHWVARR